MPKCLRCVAVAGPGCLILARAEARLEGHLRGRLLKETFDGAKGTSAGKAGGEFGARTRGDGEMCTTGYDGMNRTGRIIEAARTRRVARGNHFGEEKQTEKGIDVKSEADWCFKGGG
jgi:hypothetical protein